MDKSEQQKHQTIGSGSVTALESRAPRRKQILIISPWASRWSLGGRAGVSDDHYFINQFTSNGYDLHFLTPNPGKEADPADTPYKHTFVHTYPNFFKATETWPTPLKRIMWPALFNTIVTANALLLARKLKPDFVLGHSHYSSFPAFVTRELFSVPSGVKLFGVMDLVHTEWPKTKYHLKNIEQIAALKIPQDVWIILDDGTQGRDAALRHGVPDDKIKFLPNGINIEWGGRDQDRASIRREFDIPDDRIVVLFLARLVPSKRPEMLLNAISIVRENSPRPVLFLFVGDGSSRQPCETLVRSLSLEADVRFLGALEHARVPDIMSASDLFVSTSELTNVAIPTCEAMVCGLPVVGFDVGDTREIVRHGTTGLVVADGDVNGLGEAIAELAKDDESRKRMGKASRELAQDLFTGWDQRTRSELDIINDLIDRHNTRLRR